MRADEKRHEIEEEHNMKTKMVAAVVLILALVSSTAFALSLHVTGKWAGAAFANSSLDLNGDGIPGRQFQVNAYDQALFPQMEGAVDSTLVAAPGQAGNACPNPASEFEIEPLGKFVFRGYRDGALYADIDSSHHLCFNPAAPNEVLFFTITGGTGIYTGRTGAGTATLNDRTLIGAGPFNIPLFVDTRGVFQFTLN